MLKKSPPPPNSTRGATLHGQGHCRPAPGHQQRAEDDRCRPGVHDHPPPQATRPHRWRWGISRHTRCRPPDHARHDRTMRRGVLAMVCAKMARRRPCSLAEGTGTAPADVAPPRAALTGGFRGPPWSMGERSPDASAQQRILRSARCDRVRRRQRVRTIDIHSPPTVRRRFQSSFSPMKPLERLLAIE